jgi:hypothetical protein
MSVPPSTSTRGFVERLKAGYATHFGEVESILRGRLPGDCVETRFHASEIKMLDSYAAAHNLDREQALLLALRRQTKKLETKPVLSWWKRQLALFRQEHSQSNHNIGPLLAESTVLSYHLSKEDAQLVYEHWRRSGCRSVYAVPRHALIAELVSEGYLPVTTSLPLGFAVVAVC